MLKKSLFTLDGVIYFSVLKNTNKNFIILINQLRLEHIPDKLFNMSSSFAKPEIYPRSNSSIHNTDFTDSIERAHRSTRNLR